MKVLKVAPVSPIVKHVKDEYEILAASNVGAKDQKGG